MYVDTAIFMYAMGTDSRFREPCARILRAGADGGTVLATSTETFQEVLHRYRSLGRDEAIGPTFEAIKVAVQSVLSVTVEDLEEARRLGDKVRDRSVSARDLVHAAVARRHGVREILTADAGFGRIPGVAVVDPLTWKERPWG